MWPENFDTDTDLLIFKIYVRETCLVKEQKVERLIDGTHGSVIPILVWESYQVGWDRIIGRLKDRNISKISTSRYELLVSIVFLVANQITLTAGVVTNLHLAVLNHQIRWNEAFIQLEVGELRAINVWEFIEFDFLWSKHGNGIRNVHI